MNIDHRFDKANAEDRKQRSPMAFSQVRALLAKATYAPGYHFECEEHDTRPDRFFLRLIGQIECSETGEMRTTRTSRCPELPYDLEGLGAILREITEWTAQHERKEWLRLDGKRIDEPHPQTKGNL